MKATEIEAMFYDDIEHRHVLARGIYHPEDKGGYVDGKQSEPDEPAWIEVLDIMDEDGGELAWEMYKHEATQVLWEEAVSLCQPQEDW